MLITQATLANWQSSIHCSLCGCVFSKSQASVSPLISRCGARHRESPLTLFYSPRLTSPSFFLLTDGVVAPSSTAAPSVGGGAVARWQGLYPDTLHHHVSVHWEKQPPSPNKRVLFTLTAQLVSLGLGLYNLPSVLVWRCKQSLWSWTEMLHSVEYENGASHL